MQLLRLSKILSFKTKSKLLLRSKQMGSNSPWDSSDRIPINSEDFCKSMLYDSRSRLEVPRKRSSNCCCELHITDMKMNRTVYTLPKCRCTIREQFGWCLLPSSHDLCQLRLTLFVVEFISLWHREKLFRKSIEITLVFSSTRIK
jgi:hypothetical protein